MFVCARKDQIGSYEKRERESGLPFEKVVCPQMTYCSPDSFIHVMLLPMTHTYQIGGHPVCVLGLGTSSRAFKRQQLSRMRIFALLDFFIYINSLKIGMH